VPEGKSDDHDLLLRVSEQLISLTKKVDEFIVSARDNNIEFRNEYNRQIALICTDVKDAKKLHADDMNKLEFDINKIKSEISQAKGALLFLYLLLSVIALVIAYYK
jgi:hypothetical protein